MRIAILKWAICIAVGCLAPSVGQAQDAHARPPATAASPASWSGAYIGASAGHGWGRARHSYSIGAPAGGSDPDGISIGAFAGMNWQSGQLVVGLEADVEASGADGRFADTSGVTSVGETDVNWQGSLRVRAGAALDRTLFYATAGWAFADVDFGGGPFPPPACCQYSETVHGWTLGGGIEHALNRNLRIRAEYRYTDFGEASGYLAPDFPDIAMPVDLTMHSVRFGAAWKW